LFPAIFLPQVVAIKMITERSAIRPDEQIAFAREMKVLTKAIWGGFVFFIFHRNIQEAQGTINPQEILITLGLMYFAEFSDPRVH